MAIHKLKIFAGSGSHELAAKIAESYGCELGDLSVSRFSDGSRRVSADVPFSSYSPLLRPPRTSWSSC